MRYLICTDHLPIHLTCRATWLAGALHRKGYVVDVDGPVVTSPAPLAAVERLLSFRPPCTTGVFASCAKLD